MSDFAIIKTGGKQYKVAVGDTIKVEKLSEEKKIEFTDLLFGKKVSAEIVDNGKLKKVIVFKQHPKKRYSRTNGHRQLFTEIKINAIS